MGAIIHDQEKEPFACNSNLVCVPVIASFNAAGKIRPLYFAIEDIRLKIDNIRFVDERMRETPVFECEVTFSDRVQQVTLIYHKRENIWTMKKGIY